MSLRTKKSQSIKSPPLRVDNVPLWLKPFFLFYSYAVTFLIYSLVLFIHLSCRIRFEGIENLLSSPNSIVCNWHQYNIPYFVTFIRHRRPHVWMNHPAWFMKTIHLLACWTSVKEIILGSTGNDGKEAARLLVEKLKQGFSTAISPDGPQGPARVLKKGVLHIALQSGVSILPLRIETPHCLKIPSWDGKRIPLPFSKMTVVYGKPITVTTENFEESAILLGKALNAENRRRR